MFAYGAGGWKAFLTDNRIKVGDFLIFGLLGFSHFQVAIGRSPAEVEVKVGAEDGDNNGNEDDLPAVEGEVEAEDDDNNANEDNLPAAVEVKVEAEDDNNNANEHNQ